jgi:hypothetical protein
MRQLIDDLRCHTKLTNLTPVHPPKNEIAFQDLDNAGCLQLSLCHESPATDEQQEVFHSVNNRQVNSVPFHEQSISTRLC